MVLTGNVRATRHDRVEYGLLFGPIEFGGDRAELTLRVCVLWDRTWQALDKLPRKNGLIFPGCRKGRPISPSTIYDHFVELRNKVGLSRYRPEDLRNSTATIAARLNRPEQRKILMGRAIGKEDEGYILQNPYLVADLCRELEDHFFGGKGK